MTRSPETNREKIGTSHNGAYSYWLDRKDLYVYQMNEHSQKWIGWYSSLTAWENTMHRILEVK